MKITVNIQYDLPVGNTDAFWSDFSAVTVLDVLANDTDVDGNILNIMAVPHRIMAVPHRLNLYLAIGTKNPIPEMIVDSKIDTVIVM